MEDFIQKHGSDVIGNLNGWDRLMIRGTLRALAVASGMMNYLSYVGVLLKDFGDHVEQVSDSLKKACRRTAESLNRPLIFLPSPKTRKEDVAREIAVKDKISEGLIALLTCVEPCMSYGIRRDRVLRKLVLEPCVRQCLHIYHYFMDPDFGLMHARVQTWFPFTIQACLNGRSWLARQMDRVGMPYVQADNCFIRLGDVPAAQRLMDQLLHWDWPTYLNGIATQVNPLLADLLGGYRESYYWSAYQSEWASDIMFRSPAALERIYPALARGAITAFGSSNVLRFLGKRPGFNLKAEVTSDYRRRLEGLRVKHSVAKNSVKMYDKQGSVLRVETTVNDPRDLWVYRSSQDDPDGPPSWRKMRKGVADLRRRAEVSQSCNERYVAALATLDTSTTLSQLLAPVVRPAKLGPSRVRALRPWSQDDLSLLRAVNHAEFALKGFRNSDLRSLLYADVEPGLEQKRASARLSHRLRMLRGHHLIRKIPRTHRYQLTPRGRQIVTAVLQAQEATLAALARAAA